MSTIATTNRNELRFRRLLDGPILLTLFVLALPNAALVTAQSLATIADAYFVGKVGIVPLAGIALAFPIQALMGMMSQGAMGGGISSAIARALGAGDRARAEALAVNALAIGAVLAGVYTLLFAVLARPTFSLLGGRGPALEASVAYGQVLFGGAIAIWLSNTFASILRGTGNMLVPGVVMTIGFVLSVPLSGALTLGWFGLPALGVRGPAAAFVAMFAIAGALMGAYVFSGRAGLAIRPSTLHLRRELIADILRVGLPGSGNAILMIVTVIVVTAFVSGYGTAALAGYGLGSRLEIMLVPIAFGVGAALVALVGANRGAKQFARARRIAWTGGGTVFVLCSFIGMVAIFAPELWIGLFSRDAGAQDVARQYLQIAGIGYPVFAMGMALNFATQGTGNVNISLLAGTLRAVVVIGGGALVVYGMGGGLAWLFACVTVGFFVFGLILAWAVKFGRLWNPCR